MLNASPLVSGANAASPPMQQQFRTTGTSQPTTNQPNFANQYLNTSSTVRHSPVHPATNRPVTYSPSTTAGTPSTNVGSASPHGGSTQKEDKRRVRRSSRRVNVKPKQPDIQLEANTVPYQLGTRAVRQISMHSEEDWDAVADHAAIEWGQRRGPRRGRDADDLTVTARDIAPSISNLLDKLGCCGERKTRVLHRPAAPCHPVQQIHTETGAMMAPNSNGVSFPQGVLLETGTVGLGRSGVGHFHSVDTYGGYRYFGERDASATPNKFVTYDDWQHPSNGYQAALKKTALPQFEQSFHNRAFNSAPGMVDTGEMNRIFSRTDVVQLDETGQVMIPEFIETNDGRLTGGVRV
eukprot:GHVH01001084.1.p1 GENE.GHVH01001084.1~~GHVH01001084.1.p1  ORF type:complete len:351 (+),score=29.67 GHVH01001084.1:112-1164(+)